MNDTISRQAAIDAMWSVLRKAREALEKLPSAEPERKKGKWCRMYDIDPWECTNCRYHTVRVTPFCPSCGADMRGEEV